MARLARPPDSDSRRTPVTHGVALFRRDTSAAVLHFQADLTIRTANTDSGVGALRVTVNVREAFLYNSKKSRLQVWREPTQIIGDVEINSDLAPFRETVQVRAQARCKSNFVEQRRVEQMRDGAQLLRKLLYESY